MKIAYIFDKAIETLVGLFLLATILALIKSISVWRSKNTIAKKQSQLTNRQLGLLGIMPKVEQILTDLSKKPPKSKINSPPTTNSLVPLHNPLNILNRSSQIINNNPNTTQSRSSPASPSIYHVPSPTLQTPSDKLVISNKEITTEEQFERFLAENDNKLTTSASKLGTPSPNVHGFGVNSPRTSGTTRSTPLRAVRMSPGSQKFSTPPKKGECEFKFPPAMSIEESIEFCVSIGIHPQIEQWRDQLRQWFSSVLLNPLLYKIETSHNKVMEAAAKIGISVKISRVGSDLPNNGSGVNSKPRERINEWQPVTTLDEESLLHQLRVTLDDYMSRSPSAQLQECIDTITEHQRLCSLMRGELIKGLLPQTSVRADYTVQRIHELAEGTCVKKYKYLGSGEIYGKAKKNWTVELPTDSHLLLYLFCAYLEHPNWMLHVDPTSYAEVQSSKNPLFLGLLPPKERFPEKYIALISGVPSVLHPGATILAVDKQTPPLFALYWDKKPQFSLQGRTALWDSTLILCHRIKLAYGGIVRGMHLGSSALAVLPIFQPESED